MNLTPEQIRDMNWRELQACVTADLSRALSAWRLYGPGTTREVAARSGIELLTFRPRTSDLVDLGFVICTGKVRHEGTYRALTDTDAQIRHAERGRPKQLALL